MESIFHGAATYLVVWLIFRLAGKRSLAQITTFDAVLLLIISEAVQPALVGQDYSFTNSVLLILTMVGLDVSLSCIKQRFPTLEKVMDGAPMVLLDKEGLRMEALQNERVDREDILHAARELQGLATLEQVRYAVLEQTGQITIIPEPEETAG